MAREHLTSVALILAGLACWFLAAASLRDGLLPSPLDTAEAFFGSAVSSALVEAQGGGTGGYLPHVWATAWRVTLGIFVGSFLGLLIALLSNEFPRISLVIASWVEVLRVVPPLIFIPFVVLAVPEAGRAHMVTVVLFATLTMVVYASKASQNIPRSYLMLARIAGAGRFRRVRTVVLPAIAPELIGAMRIIVTLGVGVAVVCEYLAIPEGIGRVMKLVLAYSRIDLVMAGVVWSVLLVLLLDMVVVVSFSFAMRWTGRSTNRDKQLVDGRT